MTVLYRRIDRLLAGQPDRIITVALIAVAAFGILVALRGPRPLKAIVLGWFVAP